MTDRLCSLGLDVGTTTTQLVLSELTVKNQASAFAVPRMEITDRRILYQSPVFFTPLLGQDRVDAPALRELVEKEYEKAGIRREQVDTGAVIITGETSRKENARAVVEQLAGFAGDFVVATAGPELESVLAARGSGAVELSQRTGKGILHMDIGGGTSNLALIQEGRITRTGCLNVGGRLLKFDPGGRITYVSPVVADMTPLKIGDTPAPGQIEQIVQLLVQALEMAAGLRPRTELLDKLSTREAGEVFCLDKPAAVSFSGGVADCIEKEQDPLAFGDIGPVLGQTIRKSRLCQGEYMLAGQTIRATVIGAGSYSTQLSGSTVFYENIQFPVKGLPVVELTGQEQADPVAISRFLAGQDVPGVLALPGYASPSYEQVTALAEAIAAGVGDRPVYVCLQADMAKALGHALRLRLPAGRPCLCLDGLAPGQGSYLDVGSPVGPALPVVIKTLVLSRQGGTSQDEEGTL